MTQRRLRDNRVVSLPLPLPLSIANNQKKRQASYPKLRLAVAVATAQAAASIAAAAASAAAEALDDIEDDIEDDDAPMTPVPLQKEDDIWSFTDEEEEGSFHASPLKETPKAPWAPVRPERPMTSLPRGAHMPTRLSFTADNPVARPCPCPDHLPQSEIDDLLGDTAYAQAMASRPKERTALATIEQFLGRKA